MSKTTLDWDGPVCVVTMNDAEHMNLFSPAKRDVDRFFQRSVGERRLHAIVLAAGPHFSAGGDIKSFKEVDLLPARNRLKKGSSQLARAAGTYQCSRPEVRCRSFDAVCRLLVTDFMYMRLGH